MSTVPLFPADGATDTARAAGGPAGREGSPAGRTITTGQKP